MSLYQRLTAGHSRIQYVQSHRSFISSRYFPSPWTYTNLPWTYIIDLKAVAPSCGRHSTFCLIAQFYSSIVRLHRWRVGSRLRLADSARREIYLQFQIRLTIPIANSCAFWISNELNFSLSESLNLARTSIICMNEFHYTSYFWIRNSNENVDT